MGLVYRNFGNGRSGGGSGQCECPLKDYVQDLIALAQRRSDILDVIETFVTTFYNSGPFYPYLQRCVGSGRTAIGWSFSRLWELLYAWALGRGREFHLRFDFDNHPPENNQTLILENASVDLWPGGLINQTTLKFEYKVNENFVPTEGFITIDLSNYSGGQYTAVIASAIYNNGNWEAVNYSSAPYSEVHIIQLAKDTTENSTLWIPYGTAYFEVIYDRLAEEKLYKITSYVGYLKDLTVPLFNTLAPLHTYMGDISKDSLYDPITDIKVNGIDRIVPPGAIVTQSNPYHSWRYTGRWSGYGVEGPNTYKNLTRKDNYLVATDGTPISRATIDLDPRVSFPGNIYGPFDFEIEGVTTGTLNAIKFELLINNSRLLLPYTQCRSVFMIQDLNNDHESYGFENTEEEGINLTGQYPQNYSYYSSETLMPFRIFLRFRNPFHSVAGQGYDRTRYIEGKIWFTINGQETFCDTFAFFSYMFRCYNENPDQYLCGAIRSVGIVALENVGEGPYEESPVMRNLRLSIVWPS